MKVQFMEDNTTAIRAITTDNNPTMKHMARTHRIDFAFLHETVANGHVIMYHCPSEYMCADIFTKHFTSVPKWQQVLDNIAHVDILKVWGITNNTLQVPPGNPGDPKGAAGKPAPLGNSQNKPAPVLPASHENPRTLIEFCCGHDSVLGEQTQHSRGCRCVRITEEDDATTANGINKAKKAIGGPNTLLWSSIPCTGGCPWQHVNKHFPGGAARLRKRHSLFRKLWDAFIVVAARVIRSGGHVAIEWPSSCAY